MVRILDSRPHSAGHRLCSALLQLLELCLCPARIECPVLSAQPILAPWLEEGDRALWLRVEKQKQGKKAENPLPSEPACCRRKHSVFCQFIFHHAGVITSHEGPEIITGKACLPKTPQASTARREGRKGRNSELLEGGWGSARCWVASPALGGTKSSRGAPAAIRSGCLLQSAFFLLLEHFVEAARL